MTESKKTSETPKQASEESVAATQPKPAQKTKAVKTTKAPAKTKTGAGKPKKVPAAEAMMPAKSAKPAKAIKPTKQKMIRDSFSLPEDDYAILNLLKTKCLENGVEVKKSELVRAGLITLKKFPIATLLKAVHEVERLKTGRPKGN